MTPQDAQAILSENFAGWVLALEPEVIECAPEQVVIRMPLSPDLSRIGGIVSGQALAALADTSMVIAACAHSGGFKPFATTDLHTQFLRPGTGSAILCTAGVVRAGRALVFARAEMTEQDSGKMVSAATATFVNPA